MRGAVLAVALAALAGCGKGPEAVTIRTGMPKAEAACAAAVSGRTGGRGALVTDSDYAEGATMAEVRAGDGTAWTCQATDDGRVTMVQPS